MDRLAYSAVTSNIDWRRVIMDDIPPRIDGLNGDSRYRMLVDAIKTMQFTCSIPTNLSRTGTLVPSASRDMLPVKMEFEALQAGRTSAAATFEERAQEYRRSAAVLMDSVFEW